MEVQVSKLMKLLVLLKPAIPKKAKLKVCAYVRIGEGKAVATDLETMIIADMPEATEPMLLPYASVAEMLKYVGGNETLKIVAESKKITLSWSNGSASYPTEDYQEYPVLPEMLAKAENDIDGDVLVPAMKTALTYAAVEDSRPVLCGVTLVLGNPIEVAAGDSFRMAYQILGRMAFPIEEKVIIPAHAVAILEHVFAKTPRGVNQAGADSLISALTAKRQLHMALIGNEAASKVRFDFGTAASVIVNLIQGNPPDFLALIPKDEPILQSQLFAPQFEAAVKRVRGIAKDGSGIVRMEFANGKLTVSARGGDQELSAVLDTLNTQGEPGRTAFNCKYLLEFLAGKQGIITITQYSRSSPHLFEYQNSPRIIIMPMFVQWDDEKPEGETEQPTEDIKESVAETVEAVDETHESDELVEEADEAEEDAAEEAESSGAENEVETVV